MENESGEREQVAKETAERRLTRLFSLANRPPPQKEDTGEKARRVRKERQRAKRIKQATPKLEKEARRLKRKEEKKIRDKERVEKWIAGTYKTNNDEIVCLPAETVDQYLKKGGAITVLKPMTKSKLKQLEFLKIKRAMQRRGTWRGANK